MQPQISYDTSFTFCDRRIWTVYTKKRPYCDQFLKAMSQTFDLVVFTASCAAYALQVVSWLDPNGEYIKRTLHRSSCVMDRGTFVKDLARAGFDVKSTVIVDNRYNSFSLQPENGIKCKSFYGDPNDNELLTLLNCLSGINTQSHDIRLELSNIRNEASICVSEE
eukprot:gb/GECG01012863.1/.p1 GENE.gb/GECG01012863.1/~~gb/GECG01012863.1/.p1  ORF type:complete len:165 (+),score=14.95 gb/GECG01012863.1/:1-495(+)